MKSAEDSRPLPSHLEREMMEATTRLSKQVKAIQQILGEDDDKKYSRNSKI